MTGGLLGRHVLGRAHGHTWPSQTLAPPRVFFDFGALGDTKVQNLDEVAGFTHLHARIRLPARRRAVGVAKSEQEDVLGFEIPVNNTNSMGGLQCLAHLFSDAQGTYWRKRAFAMNEQPQLNALNVLHHEKQGAILGRAEIGDINHVGVFDA